MFFYLLTNAHAVDTLKTIISQYLRHQLNHEKLHLTWSITRKTSRAAFLAMLNASSAVPTSPSCMAPTSIAKKIYGQNKNIENIKLTAHILSKDRWAF